MINLLLILFTLFSFKTHALNLEIYKPSNDDIKFGRYLDDVFRQLYSGNLKINSVVALDSLAHKSDLFRESNILTGKLKKISLVGNNIKRFHQYCSDLNFEFDKYYMNRLLKKTNEYCQFIFLQIHERSRSKTFTQKDKDYLSKNLESYIDSNQVDLLMDVIDKYKESEPNYFSKIGSMSTKIIIKNKKAPTTELIPYLEMNQELTTFLQDNHEQIKENKKIIRNEFRKNHIVIKKLLQEKNYIEAYRKAKKNHSFYLHNKENIRQKTAWKYFSIVGKNFSYAGQKRRALYFLNLAGKMADESQVHESVFNIMWVHLSREDYKDAMKFINNEKLIKKFNDLNSKLKFWVAYTVEQIGDKVLSVYLYKKLLDEHSPLNFYSINSIKQISKLTNQEKGEKILSHYMEPAKDFEFDKSRLSHTFINSLKRINVWSDIKNDLLISRELRSVIDKQTNYYFRGRNIASNISEESVKRSVFFKLGKLLNQSNNYLNTFKLLKIGMNQKMITVGQEVLDLLFPNPYFNQIKDISKALNPKIVLSLIRQESAFNPNARSSVGARGLMQLMPNTARQYRRRLRVSQLKNPQLNIKIGVKFLKKLLKKYDGNLIKALAAYNAGQGNLRKWEEKIFTKTDNPLLMIESIPFKETQQYVKLIYRNLFFYNLKENNVNLTQDYQELFNIDPTH